MSQESADTILSLVNLYSLAIDTQRWELFDEVFTEDVIADYGPGSVWNGLAAWKSAFAAYHAQYDATQHTMSNSVWYFQGSTAYAVTYGHYRLVRLGVPGGDWWEGQGWYDDKLVKVHGKWRIQHRISRTLWWGGNVEVIGPGAQVPVTSLKQAAAEGSLRLLTARNGG